MQLGRLGALVGFSITVAGGAVQVLLPAEQMVAWALLVIGIATFFGSVGWYFISNRQHFDRWRIVVGLGEAARMIYRRASPSLRDAIVEEAGGAGAESIEGRCITMIQACAAAGIVTLRGRRGAGLPVETIPAHKIETLRPGGPDTLGDNEGPRYVDIRLSRADVRRVLAEYEAEMVAI